MTGTRGSRPARGVRPGDRGAVATMVAIMLAGGVLLGFGALVIDVGRLYVEREELQSGADAGALAIAKACLSNTVDCASPSQIGGLAQRYADDNAADRHSAVAEVCGFLPGKLSSCSAAPDNLTACLGDPPASPTRWVEVRLRTQTADLQPVLPPVFAAAMLHRPGYSGTAVGACARTSWSPTISSVFAMAISTCEYADGTSDGTRFAREPPYPPNPSRSDERVIYTAGTRVHASCGTGGGTPGWQNPGPFGWLDGGSSCQLTAIPADRVVTGPDPGSPPTPDCETALASRQAAIGTVIDVAVYEEMRGTVDTGTEYRLAAVVPFVVSGYSFASGGTAHRARSWATSRPQYPCSGTNQCISGFFIGPAQPLSAIGATSTVALIG
jgi:Flp pilus assembly protein TadG